MSLDQVGVIAGRAGEGSDAHYAQLAGVATVNQLRTALKLEPRPEPEPDFRPDPRPSITRSADEQFSCWRIKLPHVEAAKFDAALQSHLDALIAEYKRDHDNSDGVSDQRPRCRAMLRRFCVWLRPAGTPRWLVGHMGSTPPW